MKLTKEKVKASNIAVDVIDLIETKVNETVQDNNLKEQLIDLVLELINDHYKSKNELSTKYDIDKQIYFLDNLFKIDII